MKVGAEPSSSPGKRRYIVLPETLQRPVETAVRPASVASQVRAVPSARSTRLLSLGSSKTMTVFHQCPINSSLAAKAACPCRAENKRDSDTRTGKLNMLTSRFNLSRIAALPPYYGTSAECAALLSRRHGSLRQLAVARHAESALLLRC